MSDIMSNLFYTPGNRPAYSMKQFFVQSLDIEKCQFALGRISEEGLLNMRFLHVNLYYAWNTFYFEDGYIFVIYN